MPVSDAREAVIREHMDSENRLDFDATIATFDHPRYELVGTGQVFDGEDEVRRYYATSRAAFPDQRNEIHSMRWPATTPCSSSSTCSARTAASSPASPRRAVSSGPHGRRLRVRRRPHHL